MLADCKDYFQNHMSLTSCFDDLRPFMRHFTHENSLDFLNFASEAVQTAAVSFQGEV
jgi:N-terminal acetyltransferase B complex non-catalytic subunit